jgi:hypothetical protein
MGVIFAKSSAAPDPARRAKQILIGIVALTAALFVAFGAAMAQTRSRPATPATVAASIALPWSVLERSFISLAEAMPADKWGFVPTQGEFKGVRSFGDQVKHVACGNFAFFAELDGQAPPPPDCAAGGPSPATTKAELMPYLRESFAYADKVLATLTEKNMLDPVDGPYFTPNTKLGIAVAAVWHASDHYGQLVEYLRMNGIVPPASQPAPPKK